jgi:hypothetical protein
MTKRTNTDPALLAELQRLHHNPTENHRYLIRIYSLQIYAAIIASGRYSEACPTLPFELARNHAISFLAHWNRYETTLPTPLPIKPSIPKPSRRDPKHRLNLLPQINLRKPTCGPKP